MDTHNPFVNGEVHSMFNQNILSGAYATKETYLDCSYDDLDPKKRFEILSSKLSVCAQNRSIITLQEITSDMVNHILPILIKYGYLYIYSNYGSKSSGHMGVLLAYPSDKYHSPEFFSSYIGAYKPLPVQYSAGISEYHAVRYSWFNIMSYPWIANAIHLGKSQQQPDVWKNIRRRNNVALMVKLTTRENTRIAVGTYHSPCVFGSREKQIEHYMSTALVMQWFQDVAAGNPMIIGADMNMTPTSPSYQLVFGDGDDAVLKEFPREHQGDTWMPVCKTMRSAYSVCKGKEPEYTVLARSCYKGNQNPQFKDTLDYIAGTDGISFLSVYDLEKEHSKLDQVISLPNYRTGHNSDHLAIGCTFTVNQGVLPIPYLPTTQ